MDRSGPGSECPPSPLEEFLHISAPPERSVGEITDLDPAHHPEQGGLERPEIGGGDEDPHELVVLPGQQSPEELTEHVGDGEDNCKQSKLF